MKKILMILSVISAVVSIHSEVTVFDNCDWKLDRISDKINLYWVDSGYPCFYKAETFLDKKYYGQIIGLLTDFDRYPETFPGTIKFDVLEKNRETSLVYCLINFFPLKDREYVINAKHCESDDGGQKKEWVLLWYPVEDEKNDSHAENKKFKHVKKINGRWTVRMSASDRITVSVEYYNDWEVDADKGLKIPVEKKATIDALKNLIRHLK
jgi:hypothetical protein